jgi:hypothetical protein
MKTATSKQKLQISNLPNLPLGFTGHLTACIEHSRKGGLRAGLHKKLQTELLGDEEYVWMEL